MAFMHGHAACGHHQCPLYGIDQCEPASAADDDPVSMSDVLRPSSPGLFAAATDAKEAA